MSRKRGSKRSVSAARHVADFVVLGLTVFAAWFFWPSFLGGSSRVITVHGRSMEPTFHAGDLLLIDTAASPAIGDIIVFEIADNEPGGGSLVVHRLVDQRPDGTYITQGDNSSNPDTFNTTRSDFVGSPRFSIPYGGQAIGFLTSPVGLAAATGMLCTLGLWPRKKSDQSTDDAEPIEDFEPTTDVDPTLEVESPVVEDGWSSTKFSAQVVTEAEEWLQSQLVSSAQVL